MDLTETAAANHAVRAASAAALIEAEPEAARFEQHAATAVMSTNVSAEKIQAFDEAGRVLDARALRIHQADGDAAAGLLDFHSGKWAARREAFEDLWNDGRTAIYGALNTGNLGTLGQYGQFCVVIDEPDTSATGIAIFAADSAQTYTSPDVSVNATAAAQDATGWDDRAGLCAVARWSDAKSTEATDWPQVICEPDRYLEVVRTGPLRLDQVTAVRVPEALKIAADDFKAGLAIMSPADRTTATAANPDLAENVTTPETLRTWSRTMAIDVETQ